MPLHAHEDALRLIYEQACKLNGVNMESGLANKLVSYPNFASLLTLFGLIDSDCSERDATLAFVWARMHTVDEQNSKSRIRSSVSLSGSQFLQQSTRLKHTDWIYGIAVYTGNQRHEEDQGGQQPQPEPEHRLHAPF